MRPRGGRMRSRSAGGESPVGDRIGFGHEIGGASERHMSDAACRLARRFEHRYARLRLRSAAVR